MSFNKRYLNTPIFINILFVCLLISCGLTSNGDVSTNDRLVPTFEMTNTSVSSLTTASPVPESQFSPNAGELLISEEQEINLVKALESSDCYLPCYLGITPGQTPWPLAQKILSDLGGEYTGEFYENGTGMIGYQYQMLISSSIANGSSEDSNPRYPLDVIHRIGFLVEKGSVIQRMYVSFDTLDEKSKLRDYWIRYLPQKIFVELGEPDNIQYSLDDVNGTITRGRMMVVYESRGIVIEFSGKSKDGSICPNLSVSGYALIELVLTNRGSGLSLLPNNEMAELVNQTSWLPILEVLGIDQRELFNQVIANPSICFEKINK